MDSLIKNILDVGATDHRKIQEEIKRNLGGCRGKEIFRSTKKEGLEL